MSKVQDDAIAMLARVARGVASLPDQCGTIRQIADVCGLPLVKVQRKVVGGQWHRTGQPATFRQMREPGTIRQGPAVWGLTEFGLELVGKGTL